MKPSSSRPATTRPSPHRPARIDPPATGCRLVFPLPGAPRAAAPGDLVLAVPVLAGPAEDILQAAPGCPTRAAGFTFWTADPFVTGHQVASGGADLEAATLAAYRTLFEITSGYSLYRIWNFIPAINASEQGLENYRRFCRARSIAFERRFGADFHSHLPAASAVGLAGGPFALAFVAGRDRAEHFENPLQVPAFAYPVEHGPRPPSFARATAAGSGRNRRIYLSGTSAIRDHRTVGPGNLGIQITCTLENLAAIGESAGAGADLGARAWHRSFKVYLRHPQDLEATRARLDRDLLQPEDTVQYLQADICRRELRIEIEATLTPAGHVPVR